MGVLVGDLVGADKVHQGRWNCQIGRGGNSGTEAIRGNVENRYKGAGISGQLSRLWPLGSEDCKRTRHAGLVGGGAVGSIQLGFHNEAGGGKVAFSTGHFTVKNTLGNLGGKAEESEGEDKRGQHNGGGDGTELQ